jgi:hypothetical protein
VPHSNIKCGESVGQLIEDPLIAEIRQRFGGSTVLKKYVLPLLIFTFVFSIIGCDGGKMEVHHVFPQQLRGEFLKIGMDVDDFGIRLTKADHRLAGGLHSQQWNKQWIEFFKLNKSPSKEEVMKQAEGMLKKSGFIGKLAFVRYSGVDKGLKTGEIIADHSNWFLQLAEKLGTLLTALLGGTSLGTLFLSFFAAVGSMVLGLFSCKAEHPALVGVGFLVCIFGLMALIGIVYLAFISYKWFIIALVVVIVIIGMVLAALQS